MLAAQRIKLPVEQVGDVAIDSKVILIPAGDRALKLGVELAVRLPRSRIAGRPPSSSAPHTGSVRTRARRAGTSTSRSASTG